MNNVKKFLVLGLVSFIVFLPALTTDARSGCCSWHGGVCGCGCCDGTPLSATCAPYYPECNSGYSLPSIPSCPSMAYYDSLSGSCKCFSGYVVETDMFGNESCVSAYQKCQDDYGYHSTYNSLTNTCRCLLGYVMYNGTCTSEDQICQNQLGVFSSYNSVYDKCQCTSGYLISNGECVRGDIVCQNQFGTHSSYDRITNKCDCDSGYFINNGQCVAVDIINVDPTVANIGDEITITGDNFGSSKNGYFSLYIGSTKIDQSDISRWDDNKIVFTVGDYVSSGYVSIQDGYSIYVSGPYLDIAEAPQTNARFIIQQPSVTKNQAQSNNQASQASLDEQIKEQVKSAEDDYYKNPEGFREDLIIKIAGNLRTTISKVAYYVYTMLPDIK